MTSEIETKRKELEDSICNSDSNHEGSCISDRNLEEARLEGFNLGVELARKEFLEKMVFMLSKYFQSTGYNSFVQVDGQKSYVRFCRECYDYLKSLEEKK